MLLAFEPITEGNRFELDPDGIHDGNHRARFKYEGRQHGAELVNRQRVVAVDEHIPAPVADADDEQLDLEIGWRLPLGEDLENPLLRVLVGGSRALRTFVPSDHVLHAYP